MRTDHLSAIGPFGWLGYALAAALAIILYLVWNSDPQPALRRMRDELDKARKTIDELRALEMMLKNRNEELNVKVNNLTADNQELSAGLERLRAANQLQVETIDRLERNQQALQKSYDELFKRVVMMQTRLDALEG